MKITLRDYKRRGEILKTIKKRGKNEYICANLTKNIKLKRALDTHCVL